MRYHRGTDGWGRNSFQIPEYAIMGSSDCGTWPDSPANSDLVAAELEAFRKVLRANGIRSRVSYTQSGNAFMAKRWVVVHSRDFMKANALAEAYLKECHATTRHIHDAA